MTVKHLADNSVIAFCPHVCYSHALQTITNNAPVIQKQFGRGACIPKPFEHNMHTRTSLPCLDHICFCLAENKECF